MLPTASQLLAIAGAPTSTSNINSIVVSLGQFGAQFGLDKPHRLAHYLAQLGEESGGFKWDKELATGKEYEGRKDLGNTQPGDGVRFKGRSEIQLTGRANYASFTVWVRRNVNPNAPDFEANPDLTNTDPWEGLVPIWYWSTRNLNALADENNIEQITKKVNGGLNGFDVRIKFYTRSALVLLGFGPDDVVGFQRKAIADGLMPAVDPASGDKNDDGDAGPKTRAALHMALAKLSAVVAVAVTASPVVAEKPVAVDVAAPLRGVADAATGAGVGAAGLGGVLQQLQQQLTPFSMAGGWIGKLVVILIIVGAVLTVGGLVWRWYSSRKKRETIAAINAPATT